MVGGKSYLGDPSLLLDNQFSPGVDMTEPVGGITEVVSVINVLDITDGQAAVARRRKPAGVKNSSKTQRCCKGS